RLIAAGETSREPVARLPEPVHRLSVWTSVPSNRGNVSVWRQDHAAPDRGARVLILSDRRQHLPRDPVSAWLFATLCERESLRRVLRLLSALLRFCVVPADRVLPATRRPTLVQLLRCLRLLVGSR